MKKISREKIIRRVRALISPFDILKDTKSLLMAKDSPDFSFREYIKKYSEKEAQFLVWILDLIAGKNKNIMPDAKWIVKEVKDIKGEDFIKKHIPEEIIKRYTLL